MHRSFRWLSISLCLLLTGVGCKKQEGAEAEVARDAEQKLPAQEQVEPPAESGGSAAGSTATAVVAAPEDQAAYEAWFKKYNLDLSDPRMLDADPDEDGFTNREEFLADTDPHDKNSRPGIHKSIRLKEYNEVRLPIVLESIEGDRAHLKRTDQPDGKTLVVKTGDSIRGLPFKVVEVEHKEDIDKSGEHVDLSRVALEDASTKEKIVLMKDLPARTAATYAVLVSPDGKTTLKVRKGDVFSWPAEQGSHYRVMDLSQDQAVLLQVETKKTWTIPRM